VKKAYRI